MSVYATIEGIGDFGDPTELGAPWQYLRSHIIPKPDGPRGGHIGLAVIPSFITRDMRDDQPEDEAPWPWLRVDIAAVDPDDPCVLISPAQARYLAQQLAVWADRADQHPEAAAVRAAGG